MVFFAPSLFYRMCAYKIARSVVECMLHTLLARLMCNSQAKPSQVKSIVIRYIFIHWFKHIMLYVRALCYLPRFVRLFENETFASNNHYIQSTILFHHFILLLYCDILLLFSFVTVLHRIQTQTHTQFLVQIKIHFFTESSETSNIETQRLTESAIFTAVCRFKCM